MSELACVQDVLQAAEGDANAAAWMLAELHSPVTPGMSPSISPSISPWASPLGSPLASPHVSPARSHMPQPHSSPGPPLLPSIAEVAGQRSHKGRPAQREVLRASSNHAAEPRPAARTAGVASELGKKEGAVRPGGRAVNNVAELQRGEARDAEAGDAYHSFRGEALQLTRRWQSAARKATSAFSGGGTALDSPDVCAGIAAGNPLRDPSIVQQLEALHRSHCDSLQSQRCFWTYRICMMCRRQSLRGTQVCSGSAPPARESAQGARAGGCPH